MSKKLVRISLLVAMCSLLCFQDSVAQNGKKKRKKGKNTTAVNKAKPSDDARVMNLFIAANKDKLLGDTEDAVEKFKDILTLDPNNAASAYELAKFYYEEEQLEESLRYADLATSLDGENKWYQYLHAELLAMNRDYDGASRVYEALIQSNPDNAEYYFDLAYMQTRAGDLKPAIETYNKLEEKIGVNEDIVLQKQRLYVQLNQVDNAAGEIKKLIAESPGEARYYSLLAELYDANGRSDEAFEVYQQLKEIDPDNPMVQLSMAEVYRKQGDQERYFTEISKIFENSSVPIDAKVQILFPYLDLVQQKSERKEEAFVLGQKLVDAHPKEAKARAMYGDLLYTDGQTKAALEQYKAGLELDGSVYTVWQQVMFIHSEMSNHEGLAKDSKEMIELFPNQPMPYYFNGIANNALENYEQAKKSLKRAILMGSENKALLADLHSQLGDVHYSLKEYEKSDSNFDKALSYDPQNAYTLNNFSYYLSVRGEDLEKAAEMSLLSNKIEPENPSFQDTYGWVLYKQGKYDDAKQWLMKAHDNGGSGSYVILEHLGDVYFKLGQQDKAMEHWQKAKELGGDSDELMEKISSKSLPE